MDAATFQPLFRAYQRSGHSIHVFCLDHGIAPHTFYYWQKRIPSPAPAPCGHDFIELRPRSPQAAAPSHAQSMASSIPLRLVVGAATFHLGEGFSKLDLLHALEALQQVTLC